MPLRHLILSVALLVCGLRLGSCQDSKGTALVITATEVKTNSIRIAPLPTMTNVFVHFRFEGKSAEEIKGLVGTNVTRPVVITGGDSNHAQGVVIGILVESNNVPVGAVVSFQTRADAQMAKKSLSVRDKQ